MPKQLDLGTLSQDEQNERMAAAVTQYGVGTRSYNSSSEKRESDRQRAAVTAKYHAGELKIGKTVVGPICTCRSFNLPHELERHRELRSEYDWRLESERRTHYYEERVR